MADPRIVSPQEDRSRLARMVMATPATDTEAVLAEWVATEPDRTRAAVVELLEGLRKVAPLTERDLVGLIEALKAGTVSP